MTRVAGRRNDRRASLRAHRRNQLHKSPITFALGSFARLQATLSICGLTYFCSAVNRLGKKQHLEAEMGMINQRHDVLKRESQALWRVMLEEGGQRLTEKAIYALRQMVSG